MTKSRGLVSVPCRTGTAEVPGATHHSVQLCGWTRVPAWHSKFHGIKKCSFDHFLYFSSVNKATAWAASDLLADFKHIWEELTCIIFSASKNVAFVTTLYSMWGKSPSSAPKQAQPEDGPAQQKHSQDSQIRVFSECHVLCSLQAFVAPSAPATRAQHTPPFRQVSICMLEAALAITTSG